MPYAPEHKQQTRARILDAAQREFQAHGYSAVGIDALMAAAGLTRGGFYNHFKNKEELFVAVLDQMTGSAEVRRRLLEDRHAAVAFFIRRYLSDAHLRDMAGGCPLAPLSPDVARAGTAAKAAYGRFIARSARQLGQGLGATRKAEQRATAILATCVGGLLMARGVADPKHADQILKACRQAALRLLED